MYTLGQASKIVGLSKTTIHRAIARGRLPASRNDDGSYAIDPSELARAFQPNGAAGGALEQSVTASLLVAQVERDRVQALADDRDATIRERRRVQMQLTGLLTELRPEPPVAAPAPEARRHHWFGGG